MTSPGGLALARPPRALLGLCALFAACSADEPSTPAGAPPLFPADYAQSYTLVRDCRLSIEHDISMIRVLASPSALATYQNRDGEFAPGALLLKEEYGSENPDCSGPILGWTLMQKLAAGSSPETLDYHWQKVNAEREIVSDDQARCISCHTGCGSSKEGYLNTCAVP
ncbi:MAG TPA: hypothetical protein VJU61_20985 [Polyangiaceae bacterium]|nr:hypothetical protein [Polyangiaceae bacterium]